MNFRILRDPVSRVEGGTTGRLMTDSFACITLEPPWLENEKSVSCIPEGRYQVYLAFSPRFRRDMPHLKDVPNRSDILIHPLNFPHQTEGCIGTGTVPIMGGIGNARTAFDGFEKWFLDALTEGPVFVDISTDGVEN